MRADVAHADAETEEWQARRETVAQLVDGVVERTRVAGQRVAQAEESSVGELRESVERVRAEVARVDAEAEELRSRRVMLDELDDALVEAASESWQRVAAVEESSVEELQGAAERVRTLMAQADADGAFVRGRLGTVEQLVDGFVERTRDAGQRVGEVEESSVGELRGRQRVRATVDAEAEELGRVGRCSTSWTTRVEAASESWQRVAAVEESSVGQLQPRPSGSGSSWSRPTRTARRCTRAGERSRSWSTVSSSGRAWPVSGWRRRRSRRSASCASRWSGCGPRWRVDAEAEELGRVG